jgi:hypothetical protein
MEESVNNDSLNCYPSPICSRFCRLSAPPLIRTINHCAQLGECCPIFDKERFSYQGMLVYFCCYINGSRRSFLSWWDGRSDSCRTGTKSECYVCKLAALARGPARGELDTAAQWTSNSVRHTNNEVNVGHWPANSGEMGMQGAISEYQRSDYRVHNITTWQRYPIVSH